MRFVMSLLLMLFSCQLAAAGYTYDPSTGNSYNTYDNYGGGSTTNGYNAGTGSTWNSTTDRNGNMRGRDSNGNYWSYNSGTGTYYNYGTGEIRNKYNR